MATGAFCSSRLRAATQDLAAPAWGYRARPRQAAAHVALILALASACRVYRDDPPARDTQPVAAPPATSAEPLPPRRESDDGLKPSANDALNLWVLNRPKGDLAPHTGERTEVPAPARAVEPPRATVLVALGLGDSGADCATALAKREADALGAGAEPTLVIRRVLGAVRRFRWWPAPGELSAVVKGPQGIFGAIELVPMRALDASLQRALEQRAVLDGRHPRWRQMASESATSPALPAACESAAAGELTGPSGVLARTDGGQIFGGVVNLAPPVDAGVLSLAAQYGVSLAIGAAGAVLLASDCVMPPEERFAARIYASRSWTQASADVSPPSGCRAANALMTGERAWATPGADLVWAAAEAASAPPQAPTPAMPAAPDAGVYQPEASPP